MKRIARGVQVTARRKSTLDRLVEQLKSGVKNQKVDGIDEVVALTDSDKKRISKEIETLKERL